MKQLLIVNQSVDPRNSSSDFSELKSGDIYFTDLVTKQRFVPAIDGTIVAHDYSIALGRPNGQMPLIIPEVNFKSSTCVIGHAEQGSPIKIKIIMPTPIVGKEYTLRFVKHGAVPHERNSWTASIVAKTNVPATEAQSLKKAIESKISDAFNFEVTVSDANVQVNGVNYNEGWTILPVEGFTSNDINVEEMKPRSIDADYLRNLASQCAAGKGFQDTDYQGREFIPGYPDTSEILEDTPYILFTIRFAVPRASSKTRDEVVNQIVHIAVPKDNTSVASFIGSMYNVAIDQVQM